MLNHDGTVLSSGAGGIIWNDPATGTPGWLISEIDGVAVNGISEMAPDGEGGSLAGVGDQHLAGERIRGTFHLKFTVDRGG